ncbi:MAG: FAD-dependent oxidoreductase, partial [Pseudomonadales bacterium]
IYYPTGSLKAMLCVRGKALLYEYCREHGVPHRQCGKIIVATSGQQIGTLESYREQASRNGAGELEWLTVPDLRALEPDVRGVQGLLSESTGIIDSHAFMLSLLGDLERAGGLVAFRTPLLGGRVGSSGAVDLSVGGQAPIELRANLVVNCGGLWAPQVARSIDTMPADRIPPAYYARGHYYAYSGRSPFRHLVYPVAQAGGLGVHVTLDLAGQARFGPDVHWIDDVDYSFDEGTRAEFVRAIRAYFPTLDESRLHPSYTGIRPKIVGPGEPSADFVIQTPEDHGVEGLVNLYGIESPGLTAALAVAERVVALA